jgi:phage recombination protein Bet
MNAIVQAAPPRSITTTVAHRYGMEPAAFEATLRATVCQKATKEEFAAFLVVANSYNLNPLTKEIYAFPAKGGGIVPVVSVDGWARIINDHPQFDGMSFHDVLDQSGNLVAVTCRMHRKDRSHHIETTEYMVECKRGTDVWKQWPRRMLRHKALIQCARMAFGFSGIYDEDEYQRMVDVTPGKPGARQIQALHSGFEDPAPKVVVDQTTGEIVEAGEIVETQVEDVVSTDAADEPIPLEGVQAWGEWMLREVRNFDNIDALRIEWDSRKDELKEALPMLWREVNHGVANRAMVLGGGDE